MSEPFSDQTVYVIQISAEEQIPSTRRLIGSIRAFGGQLADCPIWVFAEPSLQAACAILAEGEVEIYSLQVPESLRTYPFADKVCACAQAENLAKDNVNNLVWINAECLILQPPVLFDLENSFGVAIRPVHIRNVGAPADHPLDEYWRKIYDVVRVIDIQMTVESFVDCQEIRAYFNTHAFSVDPRLKLCAHWLVCFENLVNDAEFQSGACQYESHKVFLHQAVFSAVLAATLEPKSIRLLPPGYSYPYHLHDSIPESRKAARLNDLVCVAYEEGSLDPGMVKNIRIDEPLRSWLFNRGRSN